MGRWLDKLRADPLGNSCDLDPQIESVVREWLDRIGETNLETICHTLKICSRNPATLTWVLKQAGYEISEIPNAENPHRSPNMPIQPLETMS